MSWILFIFSSIFTTGLDEIAARIVQKSDQKNHLGSDWIVTHSDSKSLFKTSSSAILESTKSLVKFVIVLNQLSELTDVKPTSSAFTEDTEINNVISQVAINNFLFFIFYIFNF